MPTATVKVRRPRLRLGRLPGGPPAPGAGRRPRGPGRRAGRARRHRRTPPRRAARGRRARRAADHRRGRRWSRARTSTWSIEVIGGIEPARSLILAALENGASVVTANKALLAEDGPTLYEAAEKAGRDLYYEAAVAGAIPILRPLRESLAGDRVTRVLGIVNGTTNFILDKMDTPGSGLRRGARGGAGARLRRGRPDRRRRGVRRRGQGRDPGLARLPLPGDRRRRAPRGHLRGDRGRHPVGQGRWTAWSSCWPSASSRDDDAVSSACTRR